MADGQAFFSRFWPEARAVSDSSNQFYKAFGLVRGGMKELLSPGVMACSLRAISKGNTGGKVVGDPTQMPGLFLVQGDRILWQHEFRHAGDHPDFASIPGMISAAR